MLSGLIYYMTDMGHLVDHARQGDSRAQATLYRLCRTKAVKACHRIVGDLPLSEELADDAFIVAFGKLHQLEDSRRFEPWLCQIARRLALRHLSRSHELPTISLYEVAEQAHEEQPPLSEEEILSAVDSLPQGYREVFRMSVIDGMSHLEIADQLVLEMVEQRVLCDQVVLTVCYDTDSLAPKNGRQSFRGEVTTDWYGRPVPKPAHGSANLGRQSSSTELILMAVGDLFDRIVDRRLLVRRMYVVANHVVPETQAEGVQLDLFEAEPDTDRERSRQEAILRIREKYGKNAILKGMNFEEGATARERNKTIGGHKA